jgi:hypothetical protein
MADPKLPKKQYRQRMRPEGFVSFTAMCLMLDISTDVGRELLRQKRLPEPVRVKRGAHTYLFFSLDLVRGKITSKASLRTQATPNIERLGKAFS